VDFRINKEIKRCNLNCSIDYIIEGAVRRLRGTCYIYRGTDTCNFENNKGVIATKRPLLLQLIDILD